MAARGSSPRIRVAAVIPCDKGIVLVRHRRGPARYHLLPGGGVEMGETLAAALTREVLEETGLRCEVLAPLFINDSIDPDGSRHMVQVTFLARETGADPSGRVADRRLAGWECVPVSELAHIDLRPPMADALVEVAGRGFDAAAEYLGALWVPEAQQVSRASGSTVTDG